MRACHVTSKSEYRSPFGAVQLGGTVVLGIDAWGEDAVGATLRVWTDERGEELLPMEGACEGDHVHYSVSYTPAQTGVVWYSFDLAASDGATWRYGAREGWTTGEGDFAYGDPPSARARTGTSWSGTSTAAPCVASARSSTTWQISA